MYGDRTNKVQEWVRLNSKGYLAAFLGELSYIEGQTVTIASSSDALRVKGLLKVGATAYFKSLADIHNGFSEWYGQEVDFVPSNLGKGYLCYFLCNGCERRVKYLYYNSHRTQPLCRTCCKLHYSQPSRKIRRLSKLIHRPYLSSDAKQAIVEYAQITEADLPQEASIQSQKEL